MKLFIFFGDVLHLERLQERELNTDIVQKAVRTGNPPPYLLLGGLHETHQSFWG